MVEKGTVISLLVNPDEPKNYMILERMEELGKGQGGWICVEMDALAEKGVDNITPFDCWRITDKYLDMQIQRGIIKIVEPN